MIGVFEFSIQNFTGIMGVVFAIISVASAITAMTPTPSDDKIVGQIYKVVEALALNVGRAKDLPPNKNPKPTR